MIQPTNLICLPKKLTRYARHLILPQVGRAGQRKLKAASVLVVGTGGLGSPISMYLAAAGVGRIGLVDFDVVDQNQFTAPDRARRTHALAFRKSNRRRSVCAI